MKKAITAVTVIALAALATVSVAYLLGMKVAAAEGKATWTGCHFGVHVGAVIANDKASLSSPYAPGSSLTFDGLGSQGGQVGLGGGCDVQMGQMVVGAFGDWSHQDIETKISLASPGFSAGVSQTLEDTYRIGGRLGFLATENTLLYGLVGYSWADSSPLNVTWSGGGTSFSVGKFEGWVFGGGVETKLTDAFSATLEYSYTPYNTRNVDLGGMGNLALDPDVHVIRAGVSYRIGGDLLSVK